MTTDNKCLKCGGVMNEGFVLDLGDYQIKQQQVWVEGEPEPSFWSGLKTKNRDAYHVKAYRCSVCYFLEFYTTDEVNTGNSVFSS
jgi:predicted nucleic-acid-binding Zn-ribbon protein